MTTFHLQQFGCRATQADGAAIERQLVDRGYNAVPDPANAAIVVLNTCTVTAAADAQARDAIRKLHAQNPAAKLIVTGCYAQRAPEELATLPGVTYVVGNSHKPQIPNLVANVTPPLVGARYIVPHAGNQPSSFHDSNSTGFESIQSSFIPATALFPNATTPFHSFTDTAPSVGAGLAPPSAPQPANILSGDIFAHPEFLSAPIHGGELHHTRPILKIQDGCNLRCSYCIIPAVRGKSRSLPPEAVLKEIRSLTAAQPLPSVSSLSYSPTHTPAREIVLSGINLGTYGRDLTPRTNLLDLLRRTLAETNLDHLRISSIEPQDVTQDLIDLVAGTDRIAHHFHMPLQSASNKILHAMHRRYRIAHYAARLDRIHSILPHAAIGADVIAGFPGEAEQDHAATLSFIEQSPFTYLHVFSYSSRPGTEAASHPDHVPASTIKRRARELRALSEQKSAAFRQSQIGRTLQVLTLYRNEDSFNEQTAAAYTPALSTNYLRVQVPAILPSNQWVEISINRSEGNHLCGEVIQSSSQTLCESSVPSASLR